MGAVMKAVQSGCKPPASAAPRAGGQRNGKEGAGRLSHSRARAEKGQLRKRQLIFAMAIRARKRSSGLPVRRRAAGGGSPVARIAGITHHKPQPTPSLPQRLALASRRLKARRCAPGAAVSLQRALDHGGRGTSVSVRTAPVELIFRTCVRLRRAAGPEEGGHGRATAPAGAFLGLDQEAGDRSLCQQSSACSGSLPRFSFRPGSLAGLDCGRGSWLGAPIRAAGRERESVPGFSARQALWTVLSAPLVPKKLLQFGHDLFDRARGHLIARLGMDAKNRVDGQRQHTLPADWEDETRR